MRKFTLSGKPVTDELESNINSFAFEGISVLMWNLREGFQAEYEDIETKKGKTLTEEEKSTVTQRAWGGISSKMIKTCKHLHKISKEGYPVIATAWDDPDSITKMPLLIGRDFKRLVAGFFNNIGFVEFMQNSKGNVTYPPKVNFLPGPDSNTRCGPILEQKARKAKYCPLDFSLILKYKDPEFGFCCLIYGPYGVGKTYSFSTLPEICAIMNLESKDPREILAPFKNKKEFIIYEPEAGSSNLGEYSQEIIDQLEAFLQMKRSK